MYEIILSMVKDTMLVNNFILLGFFALFVFVFFKEDRNPNSPVRWVDMLIDQKTGKVSLSQMGQFWGIVIGAWVVVSMAQITAAYSIFPLVFPAWLAFLGGSYAFNKYIKSKGSDKE